MIDLRSDTVTRPSAAMRQAMTNAEVGDDVYGEDPTVNALQERVAGLLGKEDALFVASGTMGNQICLRVHTSPGDEVICEAGSHFLHFEGGAMPVLSGIQARTIVGHRGMIEAEQVRTALRANTYYFPRSKVVALENTHNLAGGTVLPLASIQEISGFCQKNRLALHLDGARLWNASIASGVSLETYGQLFDSISICLSKGLGAPAGSVIAGSREFIAEARRVRKQLGGGMRQIGLLAAAGHYAIDTNLSRLAEDHANAREFAEIIASSPDVEIDLENVQTNIIIARLHGDISASQFCQKMQQKGVRISMMDEQTLRAVTHLDVSREQVVEAAHIFLNQLSQ